MAEHILNAEDIRGFFLLVDNSEQNILPIINTYKEKLCQKNYTVRVMNLSRPDILVPTINDEICAMFRSPCFTPTNPTVIVLHSIEIFMTTAKKDFESIIKDLLLLISHKEVAQIVLSVNRELTSSEELKKIEYLSTQKLELVDRNGNEFKVETLWKKPRGKAVLQKETLIIENSRLIKCSVVKNSTKLEKPKVQQTNLLSDLTFKLNMSVDERQEKDKLVLPYTEVGKITYTFDREDDFDEEDDPDEDLEI